MLALVCFVFVSTMLICSASWFIKAFWNVDPKRIDDFEKPAESLSDPFYTTVTADNPTGDDTTPYFAYTDGDENTTDGVYTGKAQTLTITDAGAKALFGASETVDSVKDKYTVKWVGGCYLNDALAMKDGKKEYPISQTRKNIFAGTHYYQITDNETGQVLFYKYEAIIKPDTMTGGEATVSGLKFEKDNLSAPITWTGVNSKETISITPTLTEAATFTGADGSISYTEKTRDQSIVVSKDYLKTEKEKDNIFNNNFDISGCTNGTFKYTAGAKAYIGSNYYGTLVRALNAAKVDTEENSIIAIPPETHNLKTYTNAIDEDCEIASGDTLYVPYAKDTILEKDIATGTETAIDSATTYRKNQVTINENITLTVYGTLTIPAVLTGTQTTASYTSKICGNYSEVLMNSGSKIAVGKNKTSESEAISGTINCYGLISTADSYTKEPEVSLNGASKLYCVFSVVEHRGGSAWVNMCNQATDSYLDKLGLLSLNNKTLDPEASPFNRFFVRSITSNVVVNYGTKVYGYYDFYFSSGPVHADGNIPLFGDESTFFFEMEKDSVITFKYNILTNQNDVTVEGSMAVNPINVKVNFKSDIGEVNITISTQSILLPISHYWNMHFHPFQTGDSATVDFTRQNIKILPGGAVYIHKNVTAEINSLVVYDSVSQIPTAGSFDYTKYYSAGGSGKLVVDGTMNVKTGVGGTVQTVATGAKIVFKTGATAKATSTELVSTDATGDSGSTVTVATVEPNANGLLQTSVVAPTATKDFANEKTYLSTTESNLESAWWYQSNITLIYSTQSGNVSTTKTVSSPGLSLTGNNAKPSNLPASYKVTGLYSDSSYNTSVSKVYLDSTVYVTWEPIVFTLNFVSVYPDGTTPSALSPTQKTFTINDTNVFDGVTTPADTEELAFTGWYRDANCNSSIPGSGGVYTETGASLIEYNQLTESNTSCTVYAQWVAGVKYYITYTANSDTTYPTFKKSTLVMPEAKVEAGENLLAAPPNYTDGSGQIWIFDYWTYNGTRVETWAEVVALKSSEDQTEFTLVANWRKKAYIATISGASSNAGTVVGATINIDDNVVYAESYDALTVAIAAKEAELEALVKANDTDIETNMIFSKWGAITAAGTNDDGQNAYTIQAEWRTKKFSLVINAVSNKSPNTSVEAASYYSDETVENLQTKFNEIHEKVDDADTNWSANLYFLHWNNANTNSAISVSSIADYYDESGGVLEITPVWGTKNKVTITASNATVTVTYSGGSGTSTGYVMPGTSITATAVANTTMVTYTLKTFSVAGEDRFNEASNGATYTVKKDIEINATATYESCIVEGTLITLADGTQKKVEDLTMNDVVLVFNHETGKVEPGYIAWLDHLEYDQAWRNIINLEFSNGEVLRIVWKHGIFDVTLNEYVYITENNYRDYIGHEFYSTYYNGTEFVSEIVTMTDSYITEEFVKVYNPVTVWHMNYFASGILNVTVCPNGATGHMNYFELNEDMTYNEEKMQADIEKYGLYTYEDFKDYLTEEQYSALPFAYMKVSIGKGLITWDSLIEIIIYLKDGGLI